MPLRKARHLIRPSTAVAALATALVSTSSLRPSLTAAKDTKPAKAAAAKKTAPRTGATSRASSADIAAAFQTFCEDWMRTLALREQKSLADIKWETIAEGVQGTYTGYTKEHTCTVRENGSADPVGKITYLEVRYEKRGASIEDAKRSPPRPVETTEVLELFRHTKGKWTY